MVNTLEKSDKELLYNKVKTNPVRVRVTLSDGSMVEGVFHQPPTLRLTDLLNRHTKDNPFLPVTDAHLYSAGGQHARYKFMTINRAMIVCCIPLEDENFPL